MRVRASHIVVAVMGVITAFMVLVLMRSDRPVLSAAQQGGHETGAVPAVGSNEGIPKIEISSTKYDLGEIKNKEIATGGVEIFNRGTAPLRIISVTTSCVCTQGKPESDVVPPGGKTNLVITVDPYKIKGFTSSKVLTISSNDPSAPLVEVTVDAHLKPEYALEPEVVDFGAVSKGQSAERAVRMVQTSDEPLEIVDMKPIGASRGVVASFERLPEDQWKTPGKAEYAIKLKMNEEVIAGPVNGRFRIQTKFARVPRVELDYRGEVATFYRLSGTTLRFSGKAGDAEGGVLEVLAPEPIELKDVAVSSNELVASAKPGSTPNSAKLVVGAGPNASSGVKRANLSFTVASATQGSVRESIEVVGVIRPSQ